MTLPRAFAIARHFAHALKHQRSVWIAHGTTIGEPEPPKFSEPSQTGEFGFLFADAETGRLFRVTVCEIDIRNEKVNRSDGT